ncbi:hypothetical protein BJ165DRAFT_1476810 [Panaeolus papilionaceus]|nr:hypothetical protein BJ165DRAFT_1476810 [Panaeolus papilionaceus]
MLLQITVPRGTDVYISILTSNRSKQMWGDAACEWKPERWLDVNERVVGNRVPGCIRICRMTFLGGGRSCIGV